MWWTRLQLANLLNELGIIPGILVVCFDKLLEDYIERKTFLLGWEAPNRFRLCFSSNFLNMAYLVVLFAVDYSRKVECSFRGDIIPKPLRLISFWREWKGGSPDR